MLFWSWQWSILRTTLSDLKAYPMLCNSTNSSKLVCPGSVGPLQSQKKGREKGEREGGRGEGEGGGRERQRENLGEVRVCRCYMYKVVHAATAGHTILQFKLLIAKLARSLSLPLLCLPHIGGPRQAMALNRFNLILLGCSRLLHYTCTRNCVYVCISTLKL